MMPAPQNANHTTPTFSKGADNTLFADGCGSEQFQDIAPDVERQEKTNVALADQTHYLPRRYIIQVSYFRELFI